jgi:hypothetical protein
MRKLKGLDAKVEMNPVHKVPRRIYDINPAAAPGQPSPAGAPAVPEPDERHAREIAQTTLERLAGDLKVKVDLSSLRFDRVKHTLLGSHVLFQQYHDGKPISDAWIRIDLDRSGRVYNIQNDLIPTTVLAKAATKARAAAAKAPSPDRAIRRAFAAAGCAKSRTKEVLETQLVYYPVDGIPHLAWKVVLKADRPLGEWKVYVDARDDRTVLGKIDLIKTATGRGRVFDPNPVVALDDPKLSDKSKIPSQAYVEVDLPGLDGTGFLDGPFVSTRRSSSRVKKKALKFLLKRTQKGFKEVMVYFHIDRLQRDIQGLGFTNVLNRQIEVSIDGRQDDNSDYSSLTKALRFGLGGVDDAEDAEIILHEYGHAIQDDQVPGWGASHEAGAMGEGFGDYLAGSFFEGAKSQRLKPAIGSWDATAYSDANPPALRRLDSPKRYPHDMDNEVHDDGEIWSACLWELRTAIGNRAAADRLVLAHHFLLTRTASFRDAANALITADQNLNGGQHQTTIRDIFSRRGIL